MTKPALTVAVANLIMASPAGAATGKLFDFDLTLPIMAGQFLLLMVFLDKTWFTPLGKVLDDRDKLIRDKLAAVKGNSEEIARMQEEAEQVLREARQAANAAVSEAKKTTQAEQEAKLEKLKAVRACAGALQTCIANASVCASCGHAHSEQDLSRFVTGLLVFDVSVTVVFPRRARSARACVCCLVSCHSTCNLGVDVLSAVAE